MLSVNYKFWIFILIIFTSWIYILFYFLGIIVILKPKAAFN
ncbi:hypothetical protein HMPREF1568_1938 [Providencia alcalifaciens PAL-3]|nr:hypothetical protein HMPREF1568_1938 [Providencia alcalifaciens PAL-3]EUC98742.1 hypothetical protein HMPREF1566_1314 [Providencia alcalifaciens PAL-1]